MSEALQTTNPEDLKKINSGLEAMSVEMTKIDLHRETIKETVNFLHEEFSIPKNIIRRLAKVAHAKTFLEEQAQDEAFVEAYETLATVNNRLTDGS
jgi:hypothetical protein